MIDRFEELDGNLLVWINNHNNPIVDEIMWFFSQIYPTVCLLLLIAAYIYKRVGSKSTMKFLIGCSLVFAFADGSSNLVKHSVKRYRPTHNLILKEKIHLVHNYEGGKYGFFSGHSANTFGVCFFVFLFAKVIRKRWRFLFFLYPIIVVYSRMYLGVHYPSDIAVGFIAGLIGALLVNFLLNKISFLNEK